MQWINEPDDKNRNLIHQALVLQGDESLSPAFLVLWERILSDGLANAARSGWASLAVDICERQREQDSPGWLHAAFLDAQKRPCAGLGQYYIRAEAFTCLQAENEDNTAFEARQLRWLLEQYQVLKDVSQYRQLQPLFEQVNAVRPLCVRAATLNGWFDLQINDDSFGPLPDEDQDLLAGREPRPADPLLDLIGGNEMMAISRELGAALIEYTPANFEVICCQITEGLEHGQRALFYEISCPQFPEDGTTVANERVQTAATRLVQRMAPDPGGFPGIMITLEMQKDGTWRHSFQLMSRAAA
jgi:hypothetical protein